METFKVKLITDEFVVEDTTNKNDVKIFMLKGEKGDPGAGAIWGTIEGDISDQTDLINLIQADLTNYYTKSETYTKSEVNNLISTIPEFSIEVVQTLPTTDISTTTIYLVPKTGATGDVYNEYIYINSNWELIGSTQVDLTDYYTKSQTDNLLNNKQDTLISGTNIKTINNNSILGSGNISISGGGTATDVQINGTSIVSNDIANIATESTYNSSTNKIATMSDIPDVSSFITKNVDDLTNYTKTSNLSSVATSGSYNDLSNTPTIPTAISDLTNDSDFIETSSTTGLIKNDGTIDTTTYSTFSGSYSDLSNKPTIPTNTSDLNNDSGFIDNTVNNLVNYFKKVDGTLPVYFVDADEHNTSGTAFVLAGKTKGLYIFNKNTDQTFNVYIKPREGSTAKSWSGNAVFMLHINNVIPSVYVEDTINTIVRITYDRIYREEIKDTGTYLTDTYTSTEFVRTSLSQTITGEKTFSTLPKSSVTPTDDDHFTRKGYVDSKVLDIYSTSETKTNKVWTDNKPIYRKVVHINALPNNDSQYFDHNITNIDEIINIYGRAWRSGDGTMFPIAFTNSTGLEYMITIWCTRTNFTIKTGLDRSNCSADITIEYTKTTD